MRGVCANCPSADCPGGHLRRRLLCQRRPI